MKRIRITNAVIFLLLLFAEIIIALFVRDNFIRPYFGDVLVTILICSFIRIFIPKGIRALPAYVLVFAIAVEVGQYFNMVKVLGIENSRFFSILLGTSFSIIDIICYAAGCLCFFVFEFLYNRSTNN